MESKITLEEARTLAEQGQLTLRQLRGILPSTKGVETPTRDWVREHLHGEEVFCSKEYGDGRLTVFTNGFFYFTVGKWGTVLRIDGFTELYYETDEFGGYDKLPEEAYIDGPIDYPLGECAMWQLKRNAAQRKNSTNEMPVDDETILKYWDKATPDMYVEEKNRCWCSSSYDNDERAICIEVSSEAYEPFAVNEVAYASLIGLCVDICQRYGKKRLLWLGDKDATLMYKPKEDELVISCHRWFDKNKSCPGDWLYSRLGEIAETVTASLNPLMEKEPAGTLGDGNTPHDWSREAFDWAVENGILKGSSEKNPSYRLNDPMTREEALVFIKRALDSKK